MKFDNFYLYGDSRPLKVEPPHILADARDVDLSQGSLPIRIEFCMSKYKPKKNNPNALKWRKVIEDRIVEGINNHLTMKAILESISHLNEAPHSLGGMYKIYGDAINEARYGKQKFVGNAFNQKIQEGDMKAIELGMKVIVGHNPAQKVQEITEDEEDKDVKSRLARLLGKDKDDEQSED